MTTTFAEYCDRVSKCLEIDFYPQNPYKLCDLRPFYGLIHKKELQDYDFWGYGDCDLVYGNLDIILNSKNLRTFNLITTHGDRVAGHFTIIRKKSKYTGLCKKIHDYKRLLEDNCHHALDEDAFSKIIYPELKNIGRIYRHLIKPLRIMSRGDYYNLVSKLLCNRFTKRLIWEYYTTPLPKKDDEWIYDMERGEVIENKKRNIPYLHFLPFKKNKYFELEYCWKDDFYRIDKFPDKNRRYLSIDVTGISYK